ncbi:ECF-type sigma factor [Tahibacter amnicola]|uniref:ECF-type sigma factor n=1 Tax=Tahibacter amnicola TaxID=2976241 RepID=A0ABY6BC01_9GAMM|nr:ECF-type sigma factor [Tahibacter amnicola]UXI67337.1 ECF-type sigma factor [Tahibacter amnicola]
MNATSALNTAVDQELFVQIYDDLRRRAHALRWNQGTATLDTTALVHESYLKLIENRANFNDKTHVFRLAALAMRQILIDHLRAHQSAKRGGGMERVALPDIEIPVDDPAISLSIVVDALDRLRDVDARLADVFSLHAFAGLAFHEIGEMLEISRSTAQRDFEAARAFLLSVT